MRPSCIATGSTPTTSRPSRASARPSLLSAGKQIRDYFNNGEEFLDVRVMQDGVRRSLYTEREVLHMKDVKGLVRGVYAVQWLAGLYLAGYAAVGLFLGWRALLPKLVRRLAMGGAATLGLVALVGLASLVGFDRLFLAFHLVSFSNDLWQPGPEAPLPPRDVPAGLLLRRNNVDSGRDDYRGAAARGHAILLTPVEVLETQARRRDDRSADQHGLTLDGGAPQEARVPETAHRQPRWGVIR